MVISVRQKMILFPPLPLKKKQNKNKQTNKEKKKKKKTKKNPKKLSTSFHLLHLFLILFMTELLIMIFKKHFNYMYM